MPEPCGPSNRRGQLWPQQSTGADNTIDRVGPEGGSSINELTILESLHDLVVQGESGRFGFVSYKFREFGSTLE